MKNQLRKIIAGTAMLFCVASHAQQKQADIAGNSPFDMRKILDASTLGVEVLRDWHVVGGDCPTRQKLVTIRVGELWAGQDYRVPVRMIVPADRKAKGFHLTGGNQLEQLQRDAQLRGVEKDLISGGVGLVYTIVQEPRLFGQAELAEAMKKRFIKTLNPRYSIQYWGWPATLMRAVTAAYAEKEYFEEGKVALSGGSKNGASPSVAILHDKRMTALHSSVAPIYDSPLRLCDRAAWDELTAFNKRYARKHGLKIERLANHTFLGGTFGPIYNTAALDTGHSWHDIQNLALRLADHIFISRSLEKLKARGVDMYFHPGTHDMVAYDISWGGKQYPQIPVYLRANSGHGKRKGHGACEKDESNKSAFLLGHFFDDVEPMLESPAVNYSVKGNKVLVTVKFRPDSGEESGRIWWMYDRGPDGSAAYINEMIPEDQWKDMKYDARKKVWTAEIDLKTGASHIDLFSNHRKTIRYQLTDYKTYLSSPYTRIVLESAEDK